MARQNGPTPKQISWSKPLKEKLPALFCNREKPCQSFRQQVKMVGRVILICDYGIGEESALCAAAKIVLR
jgi:hypothetical protein